MLEVLSQLPYALLPLLGGAILLGAILFFIPLPKPVSKEQAMKDRVYRSSHDKWFVMKHKWAIENLEEGFQAKYIATLLQWTEKLAKRKSLRGLSAAIYDPEFYEALSERQYALWNVLASHPTYRRLSEYKELHGMTMEHERSSTRRQMRDGSPVMYFAEWHRLHLDKHEALSLLDPDDPEVKAITARSDDRLNQVLAQHSEIAGGKVETAQPQRSAAEQREAQLHRALEHEAIAVDSLAKLKAFEGEVTERLAAAGIEEGDQEYELAMNRLEDLRIRIVGGP